MRCACPGHYGDHLSLYHLPLSNSKMAYLHLPRELSREDADRLKGMVESLIMAVTDEVAPR